MVGNQLSKAWARGCVENCQDAKLTVDGITTTVKCCNDDLCNTFGVERDNDTPKDTEDDDRDDGDSDEDGDNDDSSDDENDRSNDKKDDADKDKSGNGSGCEKISSSPPVLVATALVISFLSCNS